MALYSRDFLFESISLQLLDFKNILLALKEVYKDGIEKVPWRLKKKKKKKGVLTACFKIKNGILLAVWHSLCLIYNPTRGWALSFPY